MENDVKGMESTVVQYYLKHRREFTMFGGMGHLPGCLARRDLDTKEVTDTYRGAKTLKENGIDYDLFVEGQLKYRRLNNNADY